MKKRITALLAMSMLMICCCVFNVFADEGLTFSASNATGCAGEEVKITVDISNNPGIISFKNQIDYDSEVFTLTEAIAVGKDYFPNFFTSNSLTAKPYKFEFMDSVNGNYTINGTVMEFTFLINENATPGTYPITLSCDNKKGIVDENLQLVPFTLVNGSIAVESKNVAVEDLTITPTEKTLKAKGETFTITPTVTPEEATNKAVTFKSSDNSVATVNSEGVVTAVANGTATITVVTQDGNKIAECKVTVDILHVHDLKLISEKASTCEEQGNNSYYECDECGKYFKDSEGKVETTPDNEKLPLTSHKGGTATCNQLAICEICGEVYGDLTAHKYGEWTVTKQATATEYGEKERVCSVCGQKDIIVLPIITPPSNPIDSDDTDDTDNPSKPSKPNNSTDSDDTDTPDTPNNSTSSTKTNTNNTTNTSTYAPKTGVASTVAVFAVAVVAIGAVGLILVLKKRNKA